MSEGPISVTVDRGSLREGMGASFTVVSLLPYWLKMLRILLGVDDISVGVNSYSITLCSNKS